jgi:hypothetical protein
MRTSDLIVSFWYSARIRALEVTVLLKHSPLNYIVNIRPFNMGHTPSPETSNTKHPLMWGSTSDERTSHLYRCERLIGNVRIIGALSLKYSHRGKVISITHSVCVSVFLPDLSGMQITFFSAVLCHLWPRRLYEIVPNFLINSTILWKMLLNIKCVFWYSLQITSETFIVVWGIKLNNIINVHTPSPKVPTRYSSQILIQFEFS